MQGVNTKIKLKESCSRITLQQSSDLSNRTCSNHTHPKDDPPRCRESKVYKVVLTRHGQSEWNKSNKFTGWFDVRLTTKGKYEATAAGKLLRSQNVKFDVAFSSVLRRSLETVHLILREISCSHIPVYSSWRLNERHYGALTGRNKMEIKKDYGAVQFKLWRRGYDSVPPPMEPDHPYYNIIMNDPKYIREPKRFPITESLKLTILRVLPYWRKVIAPQIREGKRVLICGHGNSLRGIVKYLSNIDPDDIMDVHLPSAIPFYYLLNSDMKTIEGGDLQYMGDPKDVDAAIHFLHEQSQKGPEEDD